MFDQNGVKLLFIDQITCGKKYSKDKENMLQRQILKLKSYLYFCSSLSIKKSIFSMLHHNANYWLLFGAIFA